jgi:hypothetical protein
MLPPVTPRIARADRAEPGASMPPPDPPNWGLVAHNTRSTYYCSTQLPSRQSNSRTMSIRGPTRPFPLDMDTPTGLPIRLRSPVLQPLPACFEVFPTAIGQSLSRYITASGPMAGAATLHRFRPSCPIRLDAPGLSISIRCPSDQGCSCRSTLVPLRASWAMRISRFMCRGSRTG